VRQHTGATRLGDDLLGAGGADAGDFIELGYLVGERCAGLADPGGGCSIWAVRVSTRPSIMASR
jgi:hypothetical protein